MDDRLNPVPNLLRVSSRIMSSLGQDGFLSRYPELSAMLPELSAGNLKAATPDQLFLKIREHVSDRRDPIDRFMMQGIRLDLQAEIRRHGGCGERGLKCGTGTLS